MATDCFCTTSITGRALVCALNNDDEGRRAAAELAELCAEHGVTLRKEWPEMKDWNADLKRLELRRRSAARQHQ